MQNFTRGDNLQTVAEFLCSAEFTGEVHGELIFLSVINAFLSITAFLENALILVALHKFKKQFMLQSTHKMANLTQNEICAVLCSKRQYKQHDGEKMAM